MENITIDDTGKATVKVKLRPKSDEDYKKLKDKFKDDKVAKLYLKITCIGNDKNHEKEFLKEDGEELVISVNKIAPWMEIAWGEFGINERDKVNGGFEKVKEYYKDGAGQSSLHPINNAWCSSFANWVIIKTNEKLGGNFSYIPLNATKNNPAGAINWYNKSRYPGGNRLTPAEKPPYGALLVMKKKSGWEGHVAFVVDYDESGSEKTFHILGGNQSHKVCVQKYVFKKSGNDYLYKSKYKLLGFVLPKEYDFNKTEKQYYEYNKDYESEAAGSNR